jgi:hypothetical protein
MKPFENWNFKNPKKIENTDKIEGEGNDAKNDNYKDSYKHNQLTPQKYEQLKAILTLIAFIVMFIVGYLILYTVNPTIFKYLLSANLLIGAHIILIKMK